MRVLNASGCLDALTAPEVAGALDVFVTKTVTPLPREGNAPPRIAEVEHGMLNSIGLANPGIDHFLSQALPRLARARSADLGLCRRFRAPDYADLCDRLDDRPEVEAIELNVSCPNVDDVPASVGEIVAAARNATRNCSYTKLSPATCGRGRGGPSSPEAAGTDGLSLVNTILGLALDERTFKPAALARRRRPLRPAAQADRARCGLRLLCGERAYRSSAWVGSPRDATPSSSWPREPRTWRSEQSCSPTRARRPNPRRTCK